MSGPSLLEQLVADLGTEWCPTCRHRSKVIDRHEEQGDPNHQGLCDLYDVTDLACGHQNAVKVNGATTWVI